MLIWYFFIDDILVWMGLSSVIVELSIRYVTIAIFHLLMEGIGEAFMALLDVSNHAMFGTFVDIIEGLLSTTIVAIVVMTNDETSLTTLALIYLCSSVISIVSAFTIALSRGWLDPFLDGMFKNIAIKVCQIHILHPHPLRFDKLLQSTRIRMQLKIFSIMHSR